MNGRFPALSLAVVPPFSPMEAEPAETLPTGAGWQYEPKWDGFRCIAFRDGRTVVLQAKNGEPLTRYFPELVMAIASLPQQRFALDGEVVVFAEGGRISYDDLSQRIHPSARRVAQLSAKSPATYLVFDLLAEEDAALVEQPLSDRRKRLEKFFKGQEIGGLHLSPATARRTEALGWLKELAGAGLDGLVAKRKDEPYHAGERAGMVKIKTEHTCDCVVGGFRRNGDGAPTTLLLGLYDDEGLLHFVGATDALAPEARLGPEAYSEAISRKVLARLDVLQPVLVAVEVAIAGHAQLGKKAQTAPACGDCPGGHIHVCTKTAPDQPVRPLTDLARNENQIADLHERYVVRGRRRGIGQSYSMLCEPRFDLSGHPFLRHFRI